MGLFGWGKAAKAAGEGVKAAGDGVNTVLTGIRTLVTGDLPPDTIEKLKEIELEILKVQQNIQAGQQEIERAAIQKGGFNSFFIAGWRPMLGWIASLAIFSYYIPPILLQTFFWVRKSIAASELVPFPNSFDMSDIIGLVASLLGMGALRTIEKKTNAQDNH